MNHMSRLPERRSLVLVVEPEPGLSATLNELCDFLRVQVVSTADAAGLADRLGERPIAVMVDATAPCRPDLAGVLAEVAGHDPGLPVLLVTDAPRMTSNEAKPPLTNLRWMGGPGIRDLVEFLFMAERRCGVPGLIPL